MRSTMTTPIMAALILFACSCNGKQPYSSVTDALTRAPEINTVTFSLSGAAVCQQCPADKIEALQVEIVPEDDLLTTLSMNVFEGLGHFSFKDIHYKSGTKLTLYGKIFFGGGLPPVEANTTITVPDGENQSVSVVINF